ncbi:alpha/beta fold hydrolase [Gordonia sp. CPCC 205515]|uniref:alpha/beta fold hydrolase n=1 Tax=Gordonia sp. CPCC 205515 TaxID=3140791 RepID=UPI003AF34A07
MPMLEYHQTTRTLDRTHLAVQVRGSGPVLLLLPGQSNNHHWWDRVRADLDREHTTVTFDYRGTGGSDAGLPDAYSTALFAADALTVMDSLSIDRFDVYGTSMGGRVAQWLAITAPRRVRHLVLGCTSPGGPSAVRHRDDVRRALVGPDAAQVLTDLMYSPGWQMANPGPYAVLGDPGMSRQARRGHLVATDTHDTGTGLADIVAPTLILHGSDDVLTPTINAHLLTERIPNSRSHIFDGARHAYFDECADAATIRTLDFLDSPSA